MPRALKSQAKRTPAQLEALALGRERHKAKLLAKSGGSMDIQMEDDEDDNDLAEAQEEAERLQRVLEKKNKAIVGLKERVKAEAQKSAEIKQAARNTQRQADRAKGGKVKASGQLKEVLSQNAELEELNASLEGLNLNLQDSNELLQSQNQALKVGISDLEEEKMALLASLSSMEGNMQGLMANYTFLEEQYATLAVQYSQMLDSAKLTKDEKQKIISELR